ncbi:unnamed protein product [Acanthoscelides obtectus]|uniref:Uncharacterized protein n=1 Tax=Acanthoscelides obtectus TaxID=200917 RepID=A0A9P0P4I0_ACAOB|nr:unnamed protein product [Acanthoscelides obtectus]CAK1655381.1 hypothetical protein AOBTE_LOCUS19162 [Acanthoscelides obtectus]
MRSLSSVPDLHASHEALSMPPTGASFDVSTGASFDVSTGASPETDSSSAEDAGSLLGSTAANIALGRVYAAHSLPSHIWSLNVVRGFASTRSFNSSSATSCDRPMRSSSSRLLSPLRNLLNHHCEFEVE